jgi:hypothetical protein
MTTRGGCAGMTTLWVHIPPIAVKLRWMGHPALPGAQVRGTWGTRGEDGAPGTWGTRWGTRTRRM